MKAESLKEIYEEVAGTEPIIHAQEESPSHEPIGSPERELEHYVITVAGENGLTDALSGGVNSVPPP